MPGGRDASSCGACGAVLPQTTTCPRCWTPLVGAREAAPAVSTLPAPATAAVLTDVALLLLLLASPVVLAPALAWPGAATLLATLLLIAVAASVLRAFRRTGRTPGAVVFGVRYADAFAGTPPGPGRWPWQQIGTVSARPSAGGAASAASPAAPPASPPTTPVQSVARARATGTSVAAPAHVPAQTQLRASGVVLVGGADRIRVAGTTLVGRSPAPAPGENVDDLVPVVDLDRTVSKTHALLRWDGSRLWVADRGSKNGTTVTNAAGTRVLAPYTQEPVPPGATVGLGVRSFVVEAL